MQLQSCTVAHRVLVGLLMETSLHHVHHELQAQPVAVPAAVPAPQNSADSKELMKRIVERMPSDRAGVFVYPIDWAAYDALPVLLQGKISTWVGKTIKEMLGEEEQTLVILAPNSWSISPSLEVK